MLLYFLSTDGRLTFDNFTITLFDKDGSGELNIFGWILGGFLVGFGTKLGNGCTSGHGICGLARLSIRSWVAVPTFMVCGILAATIKHYTGLFETNQPFGPAFDFYWFYFTIILWALLLIGFFFFSNQTA